jgi:hypothetical protein
MAEEIVVKYTMRASMIVLCIFAFLTCLGAMAFGWATWSTTLSRQSPEVFVGAGGLGALWAGWTVINLAGGKPFLETSREGIFIGTGLHRYVPWENVRGITARENEIRTRFGNSIVKVCSIELHDPDNIYFDKFLHRIARNYLDRSQIIDLPADARTNWTSERLAGALRKRWQQEFDQTRESRA